jgi:Protein of unknown function (DUF2505)
MKISHRVEYPAGPEEVFAMLAEPRFQEAKCAATGALRHTVSVEQRGDRTVVTTERVMPTDGLPDYAKSMVGDRLKVGETQDWGPAAADGSREGTVDLEIHGAPVSLRGTVRLEAGGQGTVERLDGDLKARVPLIGGKIEQAAAKPILAAVDVEHRTGLKWLQGR